MYYRFLFMLMAMSLLAAPAHAQIIPERSESRPAERDSSDSEEDVDPDEMLSDRWHTGFQIGSTRVDHEDGNDHFDDTQTTLAAHVGFEMFANISMVIGYAHFGRIDTTRDNPHIDQPWASDVPDTTIAAWQLYLETDWQVADNIYPTVGLGTAFWRKRTAPGSTAEERDFDPLVRLGVGFGMAEGGRFEISAQSIPAISADTLTIGMRLDF